jgi:hypothetical protein
MGWSITVQDNERDDLTRSIGDGSPCLAISRAGSSPAVNAGPAPSS